MLCVRCLARPFLQSRQFNNSGGVGLALASNLLHACENLNLSRYLAQVWQQQGLRARLASALRGAGLQMDAFFQAYDGAVPLTLGLCDQVLANCFVNASYDPGLRNGTCPDEAGRFFVGFQVGGWGCCCVSEFVCLDGCCRMPTSCVDGLVLCWVRMCLLVRAGLMWLLSFVCFFL